MEKANFWNDACRGGAIIGLVMAASRVAEQAILYAGGSAALFGLLLEWLAMAVVFVWLLYRFTRKRAAKYSPEEGFSYGQGLGFTVIMSLLSGLIVGVAGYFYRYVLIGNDAYMERLVELLRGMVWKFTSEVSMPAQFWNDYEVMLEQSRTVPEPTILGVVFGSMLVYLVVGGLVGLIVSAVVTRPPRPFADTEVK